MRTLTDPTPASPSVEPDLGRMRFPEFVVLIAQIVAMVAVSIDAMLPTLGAISLDLGVEDPNDRQAVITMFILGMSVSPIVMGPIADSIGRRPVLFAGLGIYAVGTLICVFATSFDMLLAGRFLSGVGAAAPRILAMTIVRDRFSGRSMARVMSFVMTVFILVPALAPAIGLGLAELGGWRAVFWATFVFGMVVLVWSALRLPETLAPQNRRPAALKTVVGGVAQALSDRWVVGWTLATGCVFGAFLAFLSSTQQLLDETYGLGGGFVLVFAALAVTVGISSLINSQIVMRLGMRMLVRLSGSVVAAGSLVFLAVALMDEERLPLWAFLIWCVPTFLSFGLTFGNLNALAMQPLGALAGLGAALVLSISNLIAFVGAEIVAMAFDGGPFTIVLAFLIANIAALLIGFWAETGRSAALLDATPEPEEQ